MGQDEQTHLLREIREILLIIAEPAIAERDKKLRAALKQVVGESSKKADAVSLMDGARTQAALCKESGMDQGNLSRLVKALRDSQLITGDDKKPRLAISVPANFFEDKAAE